MLKRMGALGCCVLVLGLLAAGCGSGGDDTGSSDDGAAREAFVRDGNAVCFKANSKTGSMIVASYERPEIRQATTESESIDFEVKTLIPLLIKNAETQLEGITALEAPADEEKDVETLISSYEEWLQKADTVPLRVVVANDIYNDARELAGKMGLAKCEQTPFEAPYTTPET